MSPLWLLLGCGSPPTEPTPPPPVPAQPDVLMVTLDTTRADALGMYGASPSPSPVLDALAQTGLVIEEAQSTVPLTLPAHSSLMTGLWPDQHGVRDNLGYTLPDDAVTLAERLHDAGYATGAFVSAVVLDATFGLDQGFDLYDDGFDLTTAGTQGLGVTQHRAEDTVAQAMSWMDDPVDKPRFTWVHLYDPHRPYEAPEPFGSAYSGDPYSAEIAYADEQIARLLERVSDDAIVVFLSDHGEGNGDHNELTHGQLAYRSTLRIPLVLRGPGIAPGRLAGPASIVDVANSVLSILQLDPIGNGTTVWNSAPTQYAETLYPCLNLGLHDLAVAQDDRWRLIHGARTELFDWSTDPGETTNVAHDHTDVVERLRAVVDAHDRTPRVGTSDAATAQALAALGYVAGLPTESDAPLRDPRDAPDMATAFERVLIAARTRPPREGVVLLNDFLAEYPAVSGVRQMLVMGWEAAGEPEQALDALGPLLQARPDDPMLLARHAELVLATGDVERAIAELEDVRDAHPDAIPARSLLAELYRRAGRCADASAEASAGLSTHPESSRLLLVRGACHYASGRTAPAEADLREALRIDPDNPDANRVLGHVLADVGRFTEAADAFAAQAQLTPDQPGIHALHGAALYSAEAWLAAVAPLERATADPADAESRILLADAVFRSASDVERARALLDEATRLTPTDRRIREVRARILVQTGDVEGALQVLAEP